jgi:putative ABC transport system permease protein
VRTKEIGDAQGDGREYARTSLTLLLWAFSKPVLWASLLAWPVAAWSWHRWLDGFVYRVPLGMAGAAGIVLDRSGHRLLTVSHSQCRSARSRPTSALRYE